MFKKRKIEETEIKEVKVYYLRLEYGGVTLSLESLDENIRNDKFNFIMKSIRENKQIEISDRNKVIYNIINPRAILYIERGSFEE